jgi:hypothetical protein
MPDLTDEHVRLTVERVLHDKPFGEDDAVRSFIAELLRLLEGLGVQISTSSPPVYWLTMTGLSVLSVLLLWHLGYSLKVGVAALRSRPPEPVETPAPVGTDLSALERALASGDARAAIESAWIVVTRSLRAPVSGSLTPRQWARAVTPVLEPHHRRDLEAVLSTHEAACYGGLAPSLDDARLMAAACRRLVGVET